jgi:hypothetical protein
MVLTLLVFAGVLAAILGALVWLGRRVRRRGVGGGLMGPIDEIYHPAAHRFRFEVQVQEQRLVPLPATGAAKPPPTRKPNDPRQ